MSVASPAPERAHDGLSRRRILQGAAWAAPAIILATAAPAAATSVGAEATAFTLAGLRKIVTNGANDHWEITLPSDLVARNVIITVSWVPSSNKSAKFELGPSGVFLQTNFAASGQDGVSAQHDATTAGALVGSTLITLDFHHRASPDVASGVVVTLAGEVQNDAGQWVSVSAQNVPNRTGA